MKFCKDCKYAMIENGAIRYAKCGHDRAKNVCVEALVTGEGEAVEFLYCATMRADICGTEAKLFEAIQ
jgi:hypothetical protein